MAFWIGWIIALVAGLLSAEAARHQIRTKWPWLKKAHLDLVLLMLLLLGLAMSAWEHVQSERELNAIQQRQAGRHLLGDKRATFVSALRGATSGPLDIVTILGDTEAHSFAVEIASALKEAGWKAHGVIQAVFTGVPVDLILVVHDAKSAPEHAGVLQRAFAAAGFQAPGQVDQQQPSGVVEILVGRQP